MRLCVCGVCVCERERKCCVEFVVCMRWDPIKPGMAGRG